MTHFQEKLIKAASGRYNMSEESAKLYFRKAMQEHTAQTLDRLKEDVEELSNEINAAINSQRAEDREVPDWMKGQLHAYVNVLEKIEEVSDE